MEIVQLLTQSHIPSEVQLLVQLLFFFFLMEEHNHGSLASCLVFLKLRLSRLRTSNSAQLCSSLAQGWMLLDSVFHHP